MKYLLFLFFLSFQAFSCDFNYTDVNSNQLQTICNDHYQVGYSSKLRTSMYSSEILTVVDVQKSKLTSRVGVFYSQPGTNSPKTSEYVNIGYDRGHLTPANDMPDEMTQRQTFSTINVSPQYSKLNQHEWRLLEEYVQHLVESNGDAYVMTGIVPSDRFIHDINIPSKFWKIIAFKKSKQGCVWIADNDKDLVELSDINQINKLTGLDLTNILQLNTCQSKF